MGDRRNVIITPSYPNERESNVVLYTHWGGTGLPNTVANALERGKNRWGDTGYLARIIFSEMVKGEEMRETGYGIYATPTLESPMEPGSNDIIVNDQAKTVQLGETTFSYEDFISHHAE